MTRSVQTLIRAGFARVRLTPPLGTRMYGFGRRDRASGCHAVHDDLFVRVLHLTQGQEEALICSFDLLFFSRAQADQIKGVLGRVLGILPKQILLNTSHTHAGPMPGAGTWHHADYCEPDRLYFPIIEAATVEAACRAKDTAREATLSAGTTQTTLPISRRLPTSQGKIVFAPHPTGQVYRDVPLCLIRDRRGKPICLLFSVACHPSSIVGHAISADYPGVAMNLLDEHLGTTCSLFLQGTGADAKPIFTAGDGGFTTASWHAVHQGGRLVAEEVTRALDDHLEAVAPRLRARLMAADFPLQRLPGRATYEEIASDPSQDECRRLWAARQLARLKSGLPLLRAVPILVQMVALGQRLQLVGIEAEVVAALGILVRDFWGGVTFPLGYCNGTQCYLPTSRMIEQEGGYEVESYWEYGLPAPLAPGIERILRRTLSAPRR